MKRMLRAAVAALCVVSLSSLAVAGDAASDAKALRASFEKLNELTDPAELGKANEKFMAECAKYIENYEGKVTDGIEYVTLGLAYRATKNQEKASSILTSYRKSLVGKPAPSLDVWHVIGKGDSSWSWDDAKGQVVLVDFWATWCGPCRRVIPELVKTYEAKKKDGLLVVGATQLYTRGWLGGEVKNKLDKEAELKLNADFVKESGMTYPIVFCKQNTAMLNYAVQGIPTLVVVDRTGTVRHVQEGAGDHEALEKIIDQCLAEKGAGAGN